MKFNCIQRLLVLTVLTGATWCLAQTDEPMTLQSLTTFTPLSNDLILQKLTGTGYSKFDLQRASEGLFVNGQRFQDADGEIQQFAFNAFTGDVTYVVERAQARWVKYVNPARGIAPLVIAKLTALSSQTQVDLLTGQQVKTTQAILIPRGVLLPWEQTVQLYQPGQPLQMMRVPPDWQLAELQRGNVTATRTVLLQKTTNNVLQLALYNLDSDILMPLDIRVDPQGPSTASSLFEHKEKNKDHYFWKINWYQTPLGALAVTQEGEHAQAWVTDLSNGKRFAAFDNRESLRFVDSEQTADGLIQLTAQDERHQIVHKNIGDVLSSGTPAPSESR